jgi:hypothetical protein
MAADAVRLIRLVMTHAGQGAALECLELALAAARRAGARAVQDRQHLPPAEQLALALQAADEVLEGLALELAGDTEPNDVAQPKG